MQKAHVCTANAKYIKLLMWYVIMSKFSDSSNKCPCHANVGTTGSISLRVVPNPTLNRNAKSTIHTDVQNLYAPHLHVIETKDHLGSHHAHPTNMNARQAHDLNDVLDNHNLSLRASFTPNDYTLPSVCAEVKPEALQSLFRDGAVAIDAPMNRGQFRMHSLSAGQITGMEFIPNV